MSKNKAMIAGVFCAYTLMQGAAVGPSDRATSSGSSDGRLQFKDCFIRETFRMPGRQPFYEDIAIAWPSVDRDKLVFCVGSVASPDEQMTKAVAAKITAFVSSSFGSKPFVKETAAINPGISDCLVSAEPDFPVLATIREDWRKSDRERSRLSGGAELNLCWYQSLDDARYHDLLEKGRYLPSDRSLKFVTQYVWDNTKSKDIYCVRRMEEGGRELQYLAELGMILPTELMSVICWDRASQDPDAKIFSSKTLTAAAAITALRQKTQALCEGAEVVHEVPVLLFAQERYTQYLEQALADLRPSGSGGCRVS